MIELLILPKILARVDAWVQRCKVPAVCLALAAITFAVFGQTAGFGFVNYDDQEYVYKNPMVAKGLTLKGAVWALTFGDIGHWHPLTWLSHMADCQAYGLWAGGHHLTNVALHAVAAVLLFLALREMTGSLWRSAFVAAVFAIHPLRAESVAWISERKDVLSGVFFMLTLWAYARYARQPTRGRYTAVVLAYAFGLLSKNTLVTLPFVLLLLDWWPLNRMGRMALFGGLVKEKIPLFLLSLGSCVATVLVPEKVTGSVRLSFLERVGNAVVSYGVYLRQMVFPSGLAIPYLNPPNGLPFWEVALVFVLLAAISIIVVVCRKGRPYLLVGWLWYLGMLLPVIGIIQISYYAHADRYTYLPGIGLVLAGTWWVGDCSLLWQHRRAGLGSLMAAVMGILMVGAWKQTGYWKSSETLWTHTLACTTGNYMAHNSFGSAVLQDGKVDEAITHFKIAVQISPGYALGHNNLGKALLQKGRVDEAITQFQEALRIDTNLAFTHINLGLGLFQKGKVDEAITQYQEALHINPGFVTAQNNLAFATAHNNLGKVLLEKGRVDEAITHFQEALRTAPNLALTHINLGLGLFQQGKVDEAITQYQEALEIEADNADAQVNLGNALSQEGRVDEAITQYQEALQSKPDYADAHNNLGIALMQKGRVDEAITQYQKALRIDPNLALAHINLGLVLFQQGKVDEAITQYQEALEINPDYADARVSLGNLLLQKGRVDEAITQYQKELQSKPDNAKAENNLGNALLQKGSAGGAIAHFQKALQLEPAQPTVQNNLAWLLATCPEASLRDGKRAVELARQANALTGGENPTILRTLAAALAEAGRFSEAVESAQRALPLAGAQSNTTLAGQLQVELKLYQAGSPFQSSEQMEIKK
jgi:tetratricopeptide (TPR) repeat protein